MTFADAIAIRTLWGEARGESDDGQKAVAHVLLNRMASGRWGPNLATVCWAPMQFSCWNRDDPNRIKLLTLDDDDAALDKLRRVLEEARTSFDLTKGATHYFAVSMIKAPVWSIGATFCGQFGNHQFYRDVK